MCQRKETFIDLIGNNYVPLVKTKRRISRFTLEAYAPLANNSPKHNSIKANINAKNTYKVNIKNNDYCYENGIAYLQQTTLDLSASSILSYHRGGNRKKALQGLVTKQIKPQVKIDLHGIGVQRAYNLIHSSIYKAKLNRQKYLLIIHGKNLKDKKATLKTHLNKWLRENEHVLAFRSIIDSFGQSGSLMVVLRS